MKILLLASGQSIHTARWANGLFEAGVDVVLVTQDRLTLQLAPSIRSHQLPFSGPFGYFLNNRALKRIWRLEKPDLVNAHYASGYGTTARLSGCHPLLLSVWGSDVYEFPQRSSLHRWWLSGNLRAADQVASTSRVMAEQVRRVAQDLGEIAITPFGIDLSLFARSGEGAPVGNGTITIGTVKTLSPLYGIDILIDSFARLKAALSREAPQLAKMLKLRIVGNGPQKEALEALANRRGIASITEFVDGVAHDRVPEELSKLDIYVALSRQESFGVAILEAGACGLPTVVSDVGGLPEVVIHGETGLVVPSEDPSAAADALRTLVLDSDLRRTLGCAARDHVQRHYAWRENVERMIALCESTIATSPSSVI